jgi:hypothetical protein
MALWADAQQVAAIENFAEIRLFRLPVSSTFLLPTQVSTQEAANVRYSQAPPSCRMTAPSYKQAKEIL